MGLCKIEIENRKNNHTSSTKIYMFWLLAYVHMWHQGESSTNKIRRVQRWYQKHSHKTYTSNTPKELTDTKSTNKVTAFTYYYLSITYQIIPYQLYQNVINERCLKKKKITLQTMKYMC